MAIQAQLYSENLGFPFGGGGGGGNPPQEWTENACGFNDLRFFNLQQQPLQQQQYQQLQQQFQQQQQRNQDFLLQKSAAATEQPMSAAASQRFAAVMERQKQEIDRLIALQNERLRIGLQEYRKQQLVAILKKFESKSQFLLSQKDEEIAKLTNRAMELEEFLRRTEMERQTWQRAAKENEEMVVNLNNTIEQLKENGCFTANGGAEDAESCCQTGEENRGRRRRNGGEDEEEEEEEGVEEKKKMVCKNCSGEKCCVVFLPCRHLCSCKSCDAFLDSCPVCRMIKKASIEVLF